MAISLIRIGNSRGLRIPRTILDLYHWDDTTPLELETRAEGLLIRPAAGTGKLSFEQAYVEMAREAEERAEWSEWDTASGDGLD